MKKNPFELIAALFATFLLVNSPSLSAADAESTPDQSQVAATILWSLPFVTTAHFRNAYGRTARANFNDIIYQLDTLPATLQWLPPNRPVINAAGFMNLHQFGPTILDLPPVDQNLNLIGTILDAWQVTLADVNAGTKQPASGKKYLIVPKESQTPKMEDAEVITAATHNVWFDLRIVPRSNDQKAIDSAIAYLKQIKIYPLKKLTAVDYDIADIGETNPNSQQTRYINVTHLPINTRPDFNIGYFKILSQFLSEEAPPAQASQEIKWLAGLGIASGKPFAPDEKTRHQLEQALARVAQMFPDR